MAPCRRVNDVSSSLGSFFMKAMPGSLDENLIIRESSHLLTR